MRARDTLVAAVTLVAAALLAACSPAPRPPLATTVCKLGAHAQRSVQVDAIVSVDAEGQAYISDAPCPDVKIALQLSTAATRAGAAAQLQAAANTAVAAGSRTFGIRLTGVYANAPAGASFVAESVAAAAAR